MKPGSERANYNLYAKVTVERQDYHHICQIIEEFKDVPHSEVHDYDSQPGEFSVIDMVVYCEDEDSERKAKKWLDDLCDSGYVREMCCGPIPITDEPTCIRRYRLGPMPPEELREGEELLIAKGIL